MRREGVGVGVGVGPSTLDAPRVHARRRGRSINKPLPSSSAIVVGSGMKGFAYEAMIRSSKSTFWGSVSRRS